MMDISCPESAVWQQVGQGSAGKRVVLFAISSVLSAQPLCFIA